jgi:hypothetical protein
MLDAHSAKAADFEEAAQRHAKAFWYTLTLTGFVWWFSSIWWAAVPGLMAILSACFYFGAIRAARALRTGKYRVWHPNNGAPDGDAANCCNARGVFSDLESAIKETLDDGDLWMPSSIVGHLRDRFEPASIRPALYEMNRRRLIARHGEAFCLLESVERIRIAHFKTIQSRYATDQYDHSQEGRREFERLWRAVEDWDGFGEPDMLFRNFKSIKPRSR